MNREGDDLLVCHYSGRCGYSTDDPRLVRLSWGEHWPGPELDDAAENAGVGYFYVREPGSGTRIRVHAFRDGIRWCCADPNARSRFDWVTLPKRTRVYAYTAAEFAANRGARQAWIAAVEEAERG